MNDALGLRTVPLRLGIRENLAQFSLLVGVNGLVGALVGQERTLVPLLADRVFGITSATAALLFIATFGTAKAVSNLVAGALSDRIGRKRVLVAGWLVGAPVPLILMVAPTWSWVVAANVLLGINQGLTWSTTVMMKIDLAGPRRRGLAMGLNESVGYGAVAVSAWATGALAARFGLTPEPLYLGVAIALLGTAVSVLAVRETMPHARAESDGSAAVAFREVLARTSYRDRALAAASRTGLVNNANDAFVWGLLPVLLASRGMDIAAISLIAALYPAVWGLAQVATGPLSDRIGRRLPVSAGMWIQGGALVVLGTADTHPAAALASVVLGVGTGLAYPALLATVGDRAPAAWRAGALGVYRAWRDAGFVVGALVAGVVTDGFGAGVALVAMGIVTAASGWDAWRHLPAPDSSSDGLNALG
ncbi:MAG: MFS transporter [Actinomycetota bacterium]